MTVKAYKEHPVRETLDRIRSMQTATEMTAPDIASNENYSFARDKIFAITRALWSLLEQTPATLVNNSGLSQLHSNLQNPLSELTQFLSDKNAGHLQNAASQMEQNILPLFSIFGANAKTLNKVEAAQLIESVQLSASQSINQLASERDKLNSDLGVLRDEVKKQQERIESLVETVSRERSEAAATVSNLERQYAEKEIERNALFEKLLSDLSNKYSKSQLDTNENANSLIENLTKLRDDASKIVQVVGNIGVTGNYQQIAETEAKQANFWRWTTVVFFACGVGIAIATFVKFYHSTIDASNVWTIAIRLLYAIAITAPAWYTARESARHRSNSDRAKQTELELASIGPFIELMPEDKKIEIREKLAQSYFGRDVSPHTVKNPVDITQIKDLVVELAKAVKQ